MTGLYRADAADLIRGAHEQRATLTLSRGAANWITAPLAGSLTLAEDWSPFGQLSATVANTFSPADLALVDPRETLDVVLDAGYIHPDGTEDVHRLFTGQLEDRTARNPGAVLDLKASTADLFTHESAWMNPATWHTFVGVTEAVRWLAEYALGGPVVLVSSLGTGYRADLVTAIPTRTGTGIWSVIADIALAANVRVYVDVDGVWTIAPRASLAGVTAAYLSTGGGGIIESTQDTLSREGYHAAAAVTFAWTDAAGVEREITGKYGAAGKKTYTETRAYPASQGQADAAAQAVVRAQSTRGDSYQCEGVAAYWLRPGDTVQVTLANGAEARHIVRRVTFNFTLGTMTVLTREPSNLGD